MNGCMFIIKFSNISHESFKKFVNQAKSKLTFVTKLCKKAKDILIEGNHITYWNDPKIQHSSWLMNIYM